MIKAKMINIWSNGLLNNSMMIGSTVKDKLVLKEHKRSLTKRRVFKYRMKKQMISRKGKPLFEKIY